MYTGVGTDSSVRRNHDYLNKLISLHRVSTGDEMNIVLLRLVEYLGSTNALLSGLAYDEVSACFVK